MCYNMTYDDCEAFFTKCLHRYILFCVSEVSERLLERDKPDGWHNAAKARFSHYVRCQLSVKSFDDINILHDYCAQSVAFTNVSGLDLNELENATRKMMTDNITVTIKVKVSQSEDDEPFIISDIIDAFMIIKKKCIKYRL